MPQVVLSLGCNLGDRRAGIKAMIAALETVLAGSFTSSPVMETEPVTVDGQQPWYLNVLIKARYHGSAIELLKQCKSIEQKLGRTGKGQRLPRTADIDILLFGSEICAKKHLIIPHAQLLKRRFCLEGLNYLVPRMVVPGTRRTVATHYKSMALSIKNQKIYLID